VLSERSATAVWLLPASAHALLECTRPQHVAAQSSFSACLAHTNQQHMGRARCSPQKQHSCNLNTPHPVSSELQSTPGKAPPRRAFSSSSTTVRRRSATGWPVARSTYTRRTASTRPVASSAGCSVAWLAAASRAPAPPAGAAAALPCRCFLRAGAGCRSRWPLAWRGKRACQGRRCRPSSCAGNRLAGPMPRHGSQSRALLNSPDYKAVACTAACMCRARSAERPRRLTAGRLWTPRSAGSAAPAAHARAPPACSHPARPRPRPRAAAAAPAAPRSLRRSLRCPALPPAARRRWSRRGRSPLRANTGVT